MNKNHTFTLLTFLLLCFLGNDCYGYIDPNSGYILWQALFGAIVGSLFFAKKIWVAVRSPFIKKDSSKSLTSEN